MMLLDAVKVVVAVFLLVVLQVSAMPQLMPTEASPDLVAVLVVMLAIRRGAEAAALAGFLGGILLDALSYQHLGLTSLMYVVVGVIIAARVQPAEAIGPLPSLPPVLSRARQFAWVIVGTVAVQVGLAVMLGLVGEGVGIRFELTQVIIPTVLETALVALALVPLLRWAFPVKIRIDVAAAAPA
jgi:cell shape-determining protein MreD